MQTNKRERMGTTFGVDIDDEDRLLTDETLKEFGFRKSFDTVNRYELTINGVELYSYVGGTEVEVDIEFVPSTYSYKTVGSVKMLILALKGDE